MLHCNIQMWLTNSCLNPSVDGELTTFGAVFAPFVDSVRERQEIAFIGLFGCFRRCARLSIYVILLTPHHNTWR